MLLASAYYVLIVKAGPKNSLKNNDKPLISSVKGSDVNTPVDEAAFLFVLPGKWKLSSKDWDARYHAWQWQFADSRYAGRWFRVYQDTIPEDYAVNYLLPVSGAADVVQIGQMSGNCADFTTTGQTKTNTSGTIAAPSKWQQVSFLCDYGNQNHQVVGTSSPDGINTVVLKGNNGTHKFFFLYQDNNYNPDFGVISNILSTFHAK
ncbi:MAG: hypothetical protein JWO96_421 [Candidatus Saccharibacteria bacterium]|nr:hypothetical protein [Candidatus Saccharibacteria bacterium]